MTLFKVVSRQWVEGVKGDFESTGFATREDASRYASGLASESVDWVRVESYEAENDEETIQ